MNSITIVTPMPNPDCHAHTSRSGWKKIKATKSDKEIGTICALHALHGAPPPRWERASLVYLFWFKFNRGQDLFNFSQMMKAMLDGVVNAGIIVDDKHTILRPCTADLGGYDKMNHRVHMIITSLDTFT